MHSNALIGFATIWAFSKDAQSGLRTFKVDSASLFEDPVTMSREEAATLHSKSLAEDTPSFMVRPAHPFLLGKRLIVPLCPDAFKETLYGHPCSLTWRSECGTCLVISRASFWALTLSAWRVTTKCALSSAMTTAASFTSWMSTATNACIGAATPKGKWYHGSSSSWCASDPRRRFSVIFLALTEFSVILRGQLT